MYSCTNTVAKATDGSLVLRYLGLVFRVSLVTVAFTTGKDPSKPKETGSQNSTVRMTVSRPQKLAGESKIYTF